MKKPMAVFLITLGIGILFVFAVLLVQIAQPPPAPFTFSAFTAGGNRYRPERDVYAPGDMLVVTPTLVLNVDGGQQLVTNVWSLTTNRDALLCDGTLPPPDVRLPRNRPREIIGQTRNFLPLKTKILDFPPGDYLVLVSSSGPGKSEATWEVPFKITQAC